MPNLDRTGKKRGTEIASKGADYSECIKQKMEDGMSQKEAEKICAFKVAQQSRTSPRKSRRR